MKYKNNALMNAQTVNWANVLSWSRLALIIPITVSVVFGRYYTAIVLIIIAMLTDFFDGRVARKMNQESSYGSALDGTIDLIFACMSVAWVWYVFPATISYWPYVLAVPFCLSVLSLITLAQQKPAPTLHLWTGKVAMTAVFLLFPAAVLGTESWFFHVTGILCIITQLESFAYILYGERNPDGRSIIFVKHNKKTTPRRKQ